MGGVKTGVFLATVSPTKLLDHNAALRNVQMESQNYKRLAALEVFCRKKWGVRVRVRTRARVSLARVQDIRGLFACTGRHAGISRAHVGCALKAPIG